MFASLYEELRERGVVNLSLRKFSIEALRRWKNTIEESLKCLEKNSTINEEEFYRLASQHKRVIETYDGALKILDAYNKS